MEGSRKIRVQENLAHIAAEFFRLESNRQSLITVTRADLAPNFSESTIYFTVLPTSEEERVLHFMRRKRRAFKKFVKSKTVMKRVPFFDFQLDVGEKHRQRIDEISNEIADSEHDTQDEGEQMV